MSMKNPLTPAGIEPATFRFVAQHLNHCATTVPGMPDVITLIILGKSTNKLEMVVIENGIQSFDALLKGPAGVDTGFTADPSSLLRRD